MIPGPGGQRRELKERHKTCPKPGAAEFAPKGPKQVSPGQSAAPPWVERTPPNGALKGRNNTRVEQSKEAIIRGTTVRECFACVRTNHPDLGQRSLTVASLKCTPAGGCAVLSVRKRSNPFRLRAVQHLGPEISHRPSRGGWRVFGPTARRAWPVNCNIVA